MIFIRTRIICMATDHDLPLSCPLSFSLFKKELPSWVKERNSKLRPKTSKYIARDHLKVLLASLPTLSGAAPSKTLSSFRRADRLQSFLE